MKLLCIGDSLTYGYDVAYEARWTTILAAMTGMTVVNEGRCGDTTGGMMFRVRHMDLSPYDAYFVMGGSNDILRNVWPDRTLRNMTVIADTLAREHKPVCLGIPILTKRESAFFGWQDAASIDKHNRDLTQYRQWLLDLARERRFRAVDFYDAVVRGEAQYGGSLYADGVHPNERGYAVMARQAAAVMTGLFDEAKKADRSR